jgi:hypothetical protein
VPNGSLRRDVQTVLDISQEHWEGVRAASYSEAVTPGDLHRELIKRGLSESAAGALTRLLLSVAANARRLDRRTTALLEELAQSLPEDLRSRFKGRLNDVGQLVASARLAGKAIDLAVDHPRIFRGLAVYIDLRPIFRDVEGDTETAPEQIRGFVNGFNLRLRYHQDGEDRVLDVFADVADLKAIRSQVDRAMAKLKVVRDYTVKPHPTALMLLGEDDDVTR